MRKLTTLILILLLLPVVIGYDNDGKSPIFGWDWDITEEVDGNWQIIGNRTMLTVHSSSRQEALIATSTPIADMTKLSISFDLDMDNPNRENVTMSNYFYINQGLANQTIFLVSYTKSLRKFYYWGGHEYSFRVRIWTPTSGAWVEVFEKYFEKVGTSAHTGFLDALTFMVSKMDDGNYYIELFADFYNYELEASDLEFPGDWKYYGQDSQMFGFYKHRTYRLYAAVETLTASYENPVNMTWKMSKNSITHTAALARSTINSGMTSAAINASVLPVGDTGRPTSEDMNYLARLVHGTGEAFNYLKLKAVGNWLIGMSATVGTVADSVLFMLPFIFGLYGIFVFAIVLKAFITGNLGSIIDHFLGIYHFLASLIGRVLGLFWGIVGVISSVPFGNVILALVTIGVLLFIGVAI